jgi:predicted amidohydrolase YtcJ
MPRFLLLCLALLLTGAAAPPKPTLYRHAALFDGEGFRSDMAILVEGETIRAVVPDAQLPPATISSADVVDLSGRFVLPGLIDSHQHIATPPDRAEAEAVLRRQLYSGVTAIRDMADDLRQVGELARAARLGELASPDIYYAALMAGPAFFNDPRTGAAAQGAVPGKVPWMQSVDERTDLRLAVAMARGTSAVAVKIYADLPAAMVKRIADEAHRQDMLVWAHGMVFPATPAQVLAAGPDTMSHVCYLAYQAMARRPPSYEQRFPADASLFRSDNRAMAALFTEMRRRGTILDATLRVYVEGEKAARRTGKPPLCTEALASKLLGQAWRQGVAISAGTDGETAPGDPWPSLFEEMELLAKAGMPPAEVIRSATLVAAEAAGQERAMGKVAPGKLANFVILERNPLESLSNLRSVLLTVKRGRPYPRAAYRPEPAHGR